MATRVFAVDLGAWSVKLALSSPGLRGATLYTVVERLVPPGEGNAEERARATLAALVKELRLEHDSGYVGVYGDQVFTQVLEFGFKHLRRAELDKAVGGELEGVVPVDLEDMVYTFEPIPPVTPPAAPLPIELTRGRVAPPAEGMRVLSYAMRRERAEHLIGYTRECGFEARGILACGGAAVRLVERTPSLMRARLDGAVAVIDIGHERTDVVVVAGGKAVFSRSIARAGKQVTEAILRAFPKNVASWEAAEVAKHSDGFVASQAMPADAPNWKLISDALLVELNPFARDLRQTLAACRAKTGFTPAHAILVGGGSRLRGIEHFLTEQIGIPAWKLTRDDIVALAGPRFTPDTAPALPIDSAAMTIGMAYDAAGGRPSFDLRSGALAVKMDLSFLRAKAIPLGAAALCIAAFAAGSAYANLYRLRKAEKTLTARLTTEREEVPQFKGKSADDIVGAGTTGGNGGPKSSPLPRASAYDILLDISSKVPPKDKITLDIDKLDINDHNVELSGTVKSSEEIDLLIASLKEIKCFKDITRGPTEDEGTNKKFKLTIAAQCM